MIHDLPKILCLTIYFLVKISFTFIIILYEIYFVVVRTVYKYPYVVKLIYVIVIFNIIIYI